MPYYTKRYKINMFINNSFKFFLIGFQNNSEIPGLIVIQTIIVVRAHRWIPVNTFYAHKRYTSVFGNDKPSILIRQVVVHLQKKKRKNVCVHASRFR